MFCSPCKHNKRMKFEIILNEMHAKAVQNNLLASLTTKYNIDLLSFWLNTSVFYYSVYHLIGIPLTIGKCNVLGFSSVRKKDSTLFLSDDYRILKKTRVFLITYSAGCHQFD